MSNSIIKKKVYIDAGHGGHDPGAIGASSKESENVLAVALALESKLKKQGYDVRLSRRTNVFVTLSDRAKDANAWGADIFLSLHDNSAANKSANGFETFIYNKTTNDNTIKLQKHIHLSIVTELGLKDRGMKRANFAVIRETNMPAVLIEYGFISNLKEEQIISKQIDKQAQLTFEGVNSYFGISTKVEPNPDNKKDDKEFTSGTLKERTEFSLNSKSHREFIVKAAEEVSASKGLWTKKLQEGTISNADLAGLAIMAVVEKAKK